MVIELTSKSNIKNKFNFVSNCYLALASDFCARKDSQFLNRSTAQPLLSDIERKSEKKSENCPSDMRLNNRSDLSS